MRKEVPKSTQTPSKEKFKFDAISTVKKKDGDLPPKKKEPTPVARDIKTEA